MSHALHWHFKFHTTRNGPGMMYWSMMYWTGEWIYDVSTSGCWGHRILEYRQNWSPQSSHLASTGLVLDVLRGADLGLDVLQVRHRRNRDDGSAAGPWGFGRGADHSHHLHLVPRSAGAAGWGFGRSWAAVATAIGGLGWVSWIRGKCIMGNVVHKQISLFSFFQYIFLNLSFIPKWRFF